MRFNDLETGNVSWKPPPEGIIQCHNKVPTAIKILEDHNAYCKACYTVSKDMMVLGSRLPQHPNKLHVFGWTFDLVDLVEGARSGCHFCGIFVMRYFTGSFMIYGSNGFSKSDVACCSLGRRGGEENGKWDLALEQIEEFLAQNPKANFDFVVEPLDLSEVDSSFTRVRFSAVSGSDVDQQDFSKRVMKVDMDLEFFAPKGSVASQYIKRPPFNTQPGSDASLEQARKWIHECLHEHDECPGPKDSTLPTRIVKIIDDENLILQENKGGEDTGTYTALSYCWGGPQTFATTSSTLEHNLTGFKISDLPKTLQDAISLTRKLGIQHIWIDSLCILQDSIEDKESELPKMSGYYQNSHVTICAASAKDCHAGFLETRFECEHHKGSGLPSDLLRMPFLGPDGEFDEMLFREPFPYNLAEEPIEMRGWPFQERVLSPRILNYGNWTIWQCRHHQRSNGGVDEFPFDKRTFNYRRLQDYIQRKDGANEDGEGVADSTDELYDIWHQAVHAYGIRDNTLESDKLPAIAGLASVFAQATGDEYLAGLWRGRLLRELLWSTAPNLGLLKPKERRAPSWSWASIDNDISYDRLPPADAKPIATIVNCSATPLSPASSFGRNKAGLLEIEGIISSIPGESVKKFLPSQFSAPAMDPFQGMFTPAAWDSVFLGMKLKHGSSNEDWEPPEKCALLPLFAVDSGEKGSPLTHGLVLEEREDGTFERIADFQRVQYTDFEASMETMKRKVVVV